MERELLVGSVSDQKYFVKKENGKTVVLTGHEANVVEWIRELPVKERMRLIGVSPKEVEKFLTEKKASMKQFALEILSTKWIHRETGMKLVLSKYEFEAIEWKTFEQIKRMIKNDRATIEQMSLVIEEFTGEYSEWYSPTGINGN